MENLIFGDSIYLDELQEGKDNKQFINSHFITLEKYFEKFEEINLNEKQLQFFLNGVKLTNNKNDGIYRIKCENKLIGTGTIENNKLKRDIIL